MWNWLKSLFCKHDWEPYMDNPIVEEWCKKCCRERSV